MLKLDRKSTRLNSSHLGISYAVFLMKIPQTRSTLFPYTTLFRSGARLQAAIGGPLEPRLDSKSPAKGHVETRSEEHTSELQSLRHLVCRLLDENPSDEIYPLSLHDALPIWSSSSGGNRGAFRAEA